MNRVLIVDDDKLTAEILSMLLSARGYKVVCEHDSQAALTDLQRSNFDAVLLDLSVSGGEGIEILRSLPKDRVPIMLFTAVSEDRINIVLREFPNLAVIRKPATLEEINAEIERRLSERSPKKEHPPSVSIQPDSIQKQ